ncbi:MAG: transglutaminase domain-containing protein [Candidatus Microgenomates bacterium]|jgi:transglutaminase-like putative cysteine protease
MKFWRILIVLIITIFLFLFNAGFVHADDNFSVDSNVTYDVQSSGTTFVSHNVTLENNFSTLYATTYTLDLENIDAQNIQAKDSAGNILTTDVQKNGNQTNINVTFSDAVVGKGAQRHFTITYQNNSFAVKTGEIWEISIPKLDQNSDFRNYQVVLEVPTAFGMEAYISPKAENTQNTGQEYIYTFSKNDITQTGVTAGFGQFQVFSFNLTYHLENALSKSAQTQIALPPDTAFQKVYLQKIDPKPVNVTVDPDGNWIAIYNLSARQRVDVNALGSVQIFASYRSFPKPTAQELADDLKPTEYWQVNDPQIKALAAQLKTPKAIYDYVSTTLKYDVARVQPDVQRMGAVKALQNPDQAICMEYTDLFIAIARAAGIPAREINGYAYTENPDLQPLSLVADVLHSWPEYYDKENQVWVPIDPTWASTSGGVDYFDKLDLRHFVFVVHGESDTTPYPPGSYKLGPNPQKDVYVSFGTLPNDRTSTPGVSITAVRTLPFFSSIYSAAIQNPGPEALYSIYPTVYFDGKETSRDYVQVLPPFSNYQMSINVPFSLLGKNSPSVIAVEVGVTTAKVPTNKNQIIINSLLVISILLILIIFVVLIRLKKITFSRFFATIASVKQKIHDKFIKRPPQDRVNT